jgi:heptaprenyl diphosphate synthase
MKLSLADTAAPARPDPIDRVLKEHLAEDFERFFGLLDRALEPQARYLTETELALYRRGKKLRPMLLLLSARMMHGVTPLPDKAIRGAVSLEMLHVATLIHDDIVDHSLTRRGLASVNAVRGTETAIIIGDMQFVQAIRGFTDAIDTQEDMGLVRLVLDTAFRICCGELDELQTDPTWEPNRLHARYLETVERKTAVLFGLACEAGATLGGGGGGDARRAGFFGRRLGVAFQIMDDLLDFAMDERASGKPRGMDLKMRRVSLPLIHAMEELGPDHPVTRIMHGAPCTEAELADGIAAVRRTGGFARAYAEARGQIADALNYLAPFPRNRYRAALEEIAHHVVDRGY